MAVGALLQIFIHVRMEGLAELRLDIRMAGIAKLGLLLD